MRIPVSSTGRLLVLVVLMGLSACDSSGSETDVDVSETSEQTDASSGEGTGTDTDTSNEHDEESADGSNEDDGTDETSGGSNVDTVMPDESENDPTTDTESEGTENTETEMPDGCIVCQATTGFATYGWQELNVDTRESVASIGPVENSGIVAIVADYNGDSLAEITSGTDTVVFGQSDLSALGDQSVLTPDPRLIPLTVLDFNGDGTPDRISRNLLRTSDGETPFSGFEIRFTSESSDELYQPLDGSNGVRILGIEPGHIGVRTAIGDINGDGIEDLGISPNGVVTAAGKAVHVLFGRSGFPSGDFQISQLIPDFAQRVFLPDDLSVRRLLGLGDVNNDGFDDFAISASTRAAGTTARSITFVVYGSASGLLGGADIEDVTAATSAGSISVLDGVALINKVGDIDANGVDDYEAQKFNTEFGVLNLLSINELPAGSSLSVSDVENRLIRLVSNDVSIAVAPAGDIDGDGVNDMLLSELANRNSAIVFGGALSDVSEIVVENLPPAQVRLLTSSTPFISGTVSLTNTVFVAFNLEHPSGIGDVNGDGYDDLVMSAPRFRFAAGEGGINTEQSSGVDIIVLPGGPDIR